MSWFSKPALKSRYRVLSSPSFRFYFFVSNKFETPFKVGGVNGVANLFATFQELLANY